MQPTHIVGVDPGLVHTGVVSLYFRSDRAIEVDHEAVVGPDARVTKLWIDAHAKHFTSTPQVFIEGYRPRSNFNTDQRMVEAVAKMRAELGGKVLLNTGVLKVVRQPLLELLGCWKFSTVTHHQDLRSAARIAILGMLKDEQHNALLTDIVRAHLRGRPWHVHS